MSTVDLDDIRERVESHYVGVPPWSAGQDARVLLREVERLRAELRDAGNDLLDVRGILSPNGYPRRVPMDLVPTVAPAVEWLATEAERLRAVLCEVLDEFTDKGSIGAIHNVLRSRWVNVGTVEGWRAASTGGDSTDG